jgi:hypothetical protein
MALNSIPTEVILSPSCSSLGHLHLDWQPQPGAYLELEGQAYLVLERRHRYQLRSGRYQLYRIALYVQKAPMHLDDRSLWDGHWVIGDATCAYNAHSELISCAVNPEGPCERCLHYRWAVPRETD